MPPGYVSLSNILKLKLREKGIETQYIQVGAQYPANTFLEPPMSLKWTHIEFEARIAAFSYFVSGFCMAAEIGRYCSIGENVQIGRQDHPLDWVSTHPFQYLTEKMFDIGFDFSESDRYHSHLTHLVGVKSGTVYPPKKTIIGNDVWIGHGAFIRAGVRIGDGAVIAAGSVVVKDVEPFAIVGGNPASFIRYRFQNDIVSGLLASQWWRYAPWHLANMPFDHPGAFVERLPSWVEGVEPYTPGFIRIGDLIC